MSGREDDGEGSPLVAVLGGGQLGRMLGLAAVSHDVRCRFLDPTEAAPAAAVGPLLVGDLGDDDALAAVAAGADVVTFEWEGVPHQGVRALSARVPVRPGWRALAVAQDRLEEKTTLERLGIRVATFARVDTRDDLDVALGLLGGAAVLKTRSGGYDGKGQRVVHGATGADAAFAAMRGAPCVAEALVDFDRELSVIAARSLDGEVRCYPIVENTHRHGILRHSRAPAPGADAATQKAAEAIASALLDDLEYVGVLAVELFEVRGELVANEIAPRVHNSGHWTIEGAETSQFDQHLRAVLGWPLGSPAVRGHAAMVNAIGSLPARDAVLGVPGAHYHAYGKTPRPGRKVGHVTLTAESADALDTRLEQLRSVAPELFP